MTIIDPRRAGATLLTPPGADRTPEWFAARQRGIGGSEIAAIVGRNPYSTAAKVWASKLPSWRPEPPTEAMLAGIRDEPHVADVWSHGTGIAAEPTGTWLAADGLALASPDRLTADGGGLEIKTHGSSQCHVWHHPVDIPWHAYAQAQWCMHVTGAPHWHVVAWCRGAAELVRTERVDADRDVAAYLLYRAEEFWHHVTTLTAPDGLDDTDPGDPYDVYEAGSSITDDGFVGWRARIEELTARRNLLTGPIDDEIGELRDKIRTALAGAEYGRDSTKRILVRNAEVTTRSTDVKRLQADYPDVYDTVVAAKTHTRLSFPKEQT
jgi:putative phage-type endonuclease